MKEFKKYMERQGIEEIALSYCGPVYGIRWRPLDMGQTKGIAAASANHHVGLFPLGGGFGCSIQDFKSLQDVNPKAVISDFSTFTIFADKNEFGISEFAIPKLDSAKFLLRPLFSRDCHHFVTNLL